MIGREQPLKPFETLRWARDVAHREHRNIKTGEWRRLKPLEVALLMNLALYANEEGQSWPALKTLVMDIGLTPTKAGRHSRVSRALSDLRDMGLIYSKAGKYGKPAIREVLCDPARDLPGRPVTIPPTRESLKGGGLIPNDSPQRGTTCSLHGGTQELPRNDHSSRVL